MEEKKEFLVTVYRKGSSIKITDKMRVYTNDPEIARQDGFDCAIMNTRWVGDNWTREKQEQCFDVLVWER